MSFNKSLAGSVLAVATIVVLINSFVMVQAAEVDDPMTPQAVQELKELAPVSLGLVDEAIITLSPGWQAMSREQQEVFLRLYDPAGTGDVDTTYVAEVLENYETIRTTMSGAIEVVYAARAGNCTGQRLYYTDLSRLYVCPYLFEEENEMRKARTLIHEMAHIAMQVNDRPYYRPTSRQYAQLTPKGSWLAEIPFVGHVLREALRGDTLYHPDAYAHFALLNAGHVNIYAQAANDKQDRP